MLALMDLFSCTGDTGRHLTTSYPLFHSSEYMHIAVLVSRSMIHFDTELCPYWDIGILELILYSTEMNTYS